MYTFTTAKSSTSNVSQNVKIVKDTSFTNGTNKAVYSIGKNKATLCCKFNLSGGVTVKKCGIKLYNSKKKLIKNYSENVNLSAIVINSFF